MSIDWSDIDARLDDGNAITDYLEAVTAVNAGLEPGSAEWESALQAHLEAYYAC